MADFSDVIKGRRGIRKYREEEIPDEILYKVFDAVRWSPSWANTQCWELVAVKKPENKERLQETVPKTNPAFNSVTQAPVVVALCGKLQSSGYYKGEVTTKFGDWIMFDLGIAAQSLCLAAHDLGLGSVIIGVFDHDKAANAVDLPSGYELVALIPLGYPAKESSPPKRRQVGEFVHEEGF